MAITSRRMKVDLALLTAAFLLNMSAFVSLEGLQSSLNAEVGTMSLTAVYLAQLVTSLFLPSIVIDFLQNRRAMGLATLCYAMYSLANCYPKPYTLIAGALIMGSGGSVLWAAGRVYISDLANAYAKQEGLEKSKTTASFFGAFMGVACFCFLIGNAVTSVVLQSAVVTEPSEVATNPNGTYTHESPTPTTPHEVTTLQKNVAPHISMRCGMHNCEEAHHHRNFTTPASQSSTNTAVLSILFASFAAVQICAALIFFCGINDVPREVVDRGDVAKSAEKDESKTLLTNDSQLCEIEKTKDNSVEATTGNETSKTTEGDGLKNISSLKNEQDKALVENKELTTRHRIARQALATLRFIIFNTSGMMLIPITIHIGLLQGFALGQFTRHWVTCILGLQYTAYAMSVFGVGTIIGSYGSGLLTQLVGRRVVMGATFVLELAVGVFLFIWQAETDDEVWIFFVVFGFIGILHAVTKTIPPTLYSLFFPAEKEAANAAACVWDALGSATAYAISAHICNATFMIILVVLSGVGTVLYFVTEGRYAKSMQAERTRKNSVGDKFALDENNGS